MPLIHPKTLGPLGPLHKTAAPKTAPDETGIPELDQDKVGGRAVRRIFGMKADPADDMIGRGTGKRISIGQVGGDGPKLSFSASGRLLLDNKLAGPKPGVGGDAVATYAAAQIAASRPKGLFAGLSMSSAMRGRVMGQLSETIDYAQSGASSQHKEKAFAGAMTLLIDLARATPKSDTTVRRAVIDRALQALSRETDVEQVGFYLQSMRDLFSKLDKVQVRALKLILKRALPKRPLVEQYTAGRTKPLVIKHMIHEEFWKQELSYFTKKNGFKLVKKNKADTKREYVGRLKDPNKKKKDLEIKIVIEKGELDFFDGMSDPDTHVLMYSGHSSLGGNGHQAVDAAGPMKGEFPKLVFVANCRGKDNYADFTNKYPDAHCIMTEQPTYGVSGQDRIEGLFDTLVKGNTYRYMRSVTEFQWWDEPADNYFYPDEWRKFGFMDSDSDGKADLSKLGKDRLFNVENRAAGEKFLRAVNFANSELFYHWEVEHDNGKKSFYGKDYGDSIVPDGVIADPGPNEVIRVTPVEKKGKGGKTATRFRVRFNPKHAKQNSENVYAALVTTHTVMALAEHKLGSANPKEALRAVLMGAQGIHYLNVYEDTAADAMRTFLAKVGLPKSLSPKKVDALFEAYDAHANNEQVEAFAAMLKDQHGVDIDAWFAKFTGAAAVA